MIIVLLDIIITVFLMLISSIAILF